MLPMDMNPGKQWRYLPKNKHNAIVCLLAFRGQIRLPMGMSHLVHEIDIMEDYKISMSILILCLISNIERKETDLNEARVLIDCIKRIVPPAVERRRNIIRFLDKAYNELKTGQDPINQTP
ncbi:MAG: hypothetical protein DRP56_04425 [Planctomycetota bacterium]|nr:MAG: hypothetical protein DRP56_04425 [Planctomycetota bacterium]